MSRHLLTTLLLLLLGALSAQRDTIYGDLTEDEVPEMLVTVRHDTAVFDSSHMVAVLASAYVCRRINGSWQPWEEARGYLLHAYEEVGMTRFHPSIERGTLVLKHSNYGTVSIETTHRFRWQNEQFELIGYTNTLWERCERTRKFDYNLSTGVYRIEKAIFNCEQLKDGAAQEQTVAYRGRHRRKNPYLLLQSDYLNITVDAKGEQMRRF